MLFICFLPLFTYFFFLVYFFYLISILFHLSFLVNHHMRFRKCLSAKFWRPTHKIDMWAISGWFPFCKNRSTHSSDATTATTINTKTTEEKSFVGGKHYMENVFWDLFRTLALECQEILKTVDLVCLLFYSDSYGWHSKFSILPYPLEDIKVFPFKLLMF